MIYNLPLVTRTGSTTKNAMPGNALPDVMPVQHSRCTRVQYRDEYSKSQHHHSPATPAQNLSRQTPQWPAKARTTNACEAFHLPRQTRSHGAIFSIPSQSLSRRYNIITWRSPPFQPCCSSTNQIRSGLGSTCDTTITCVRACENTSFTHASARTVNLSYCTVPEDYPKTLFPCRGIYDCEALQRYTRGIAQVLICALCEYRAASCDKVLY